MTQPGVCLAFCLLLVSCNLMRAEEVKLQLGNEIISGPKDPAERAGWFEKMKGWRDSAKKRIKYNDEQYRRPELKPPS